MEVEKVIDGHPYSTQSSEYISASPSPRRVNESSPSHNGYLVISQHHKSLVGPYWAELCTRDDAEEELKYAVRSDVAALCGVPLQAVRHVTCEVTRDGAGVELRFEVEHDSRRLTTSELSACVAQGAWVELDTLYAAHHLISILPTPRQLDEMAVYEFNEGQDNVNGGSESDSPLPRRLRTDHADAALSLENSSEGLHKVMQRNAAPLSPPPVSIARVAHVEQWLKGDCGLDSLAAQKEELAEQLALAQASSKVEELEELAEQIAFREAMMSAMALQQQQRARSRECAAMIERCSARTGHATEPNSTHPNSSRAHSMNDEDDAAGDRAVHLQNSAQNTPHLALTPHGFGAPQSVAADHSPPPIPPLRLLHTSHKEAQTHHTTMNSTGSNKNDGHHAAMLERLTQLEQKCREYQQTIEVLKSERCELEAKEARTREELQMVLEVLQEKKATIAALSAEQQKHAEVGSTHNDEENDETGEDIIVSQHHKSLVGPYWAELCTRDDAEEEVKYAVRSDVAALCGVPLQAVRHVTCEVTRDGAGVELRFEVEHDSRRLTTSEVSACVAQGAWVELDRLYTHHTHYCTQLVQQKQSHAATEAALRAEVDQLTRLLQHALSCPTPSPSGYVSTLIQYHILSPSQRCITLVVNAYTKSCHVWRRGVFAVMSLADSLTSAWATLRYRFSRLWHGADASYELHWALQAELHAVQQAVAYCEAQYSHFEHDMTYWATVRRDLDVALCHLLSDVRLLTRCAQHLLPTQDEQQVSSTTACLQQCHYERNKERMVAWLREHLGRASRALCVAQAQAEQVRRQLARHQTRLQRAERTTMAMRRCIVPIISSSSNSQSNANAIHKPSQQQRMVQRAEAHRRALLTRVAALKATWRSASTGLMQLYEGRVRDISRQIDYVKTLSDEATDPSNDDESPMRPVISSEEEWALLREVCAASQDSRSEVLRDGTWLSVCLGSMLCMIMSTLRYRRRERS